MEDHIHILSDLHPSICLNDYVKEIKVASSLWMKQSGKFPAFVGWQEGYGAFSYSHSHIGQVYDYILNQEQHHKKKTFKQEYLQFLKKFEVEYNEKYLFEWYD